MNLSDLYQVDEQVFKKAQVLLEKKKAELEAFSEGVNAGMELMLSGVKEFLKQEGAEEHGDS